MTDQEIKKETQDHAIRIALLEQSMRGIRDELHQINASVGKLVWVVISAMVLAAMQFILKGGLGA